MDNEKKHQRNNRQQNSLNYLYHCIKNFTLNTNEYSDLVFLKNINNKKYDFNYTQNSRNSKIKALPLTVQLSTNSTNANPKLEGRENSYNDFKSLSSFNLVRNILKIR